jgi:hypothetical protein
MSLDVLRKTNLPHIKCGNVRANCSFCLPLSISAARSQTAPAPEPTLQQALIRARYPVVLRDSELSGTGAILLNNAIHPSRFVMLGEDHFTREIPRFAEALCDIMHPDAYAIEAGPYAARFVNSLLSNPNRLKIMAERSRAFPNNMAFLDAREENDLAAHCAASSRNPDFAVWGLDQEFLGSASTLLAAMAASNPGPAALAAITAAQLKDHAAEAEARRTGDSTSCSSRQRQTTICRLYKKRSTWTAIRRARTFSANSLSRIPSIG